MQEKELLRVYMAKQMFWATLESWQQKIMIYDMGEKTETMFRLIVYMQTKMRG